LKRKPSKSKAKRSPAGESRPREVARLAKQIIAHADDDFRRMQEKLRSRPKRFQGDEFRLPEDVAYFLENLFGYPTAKLPDGNSVIADMHRLHRLAWDAYMEGCRQGFIEGFVLRSAPDHKRSAAANASKRTAIVTVGKASMTRDERDALIAAEYGHLRMLMKHTPACQRLAGKYEFESWQGVAKNIEAFEKRRAQ